MFTFVPLTIDYDLPLFDSDRIKPEDKDAAWQIRSNVELARGYAEDFGAAIQLFDCATALRIHAAEQIQALPPQHRFDRQNAASVELERQIRTYSKWCFIAARDGAVTLFNLGKAMEGIRAAVPRCPSLFALIDKDALAESTRILRRRFPRFEGVRHAVAHAAEANQKAAKHATTEAMTGPIFQKPEGIPLFIGPSLINREFTSTYNGKVISYEISVASFEHVKQAIIKLIDAFRPAVNEFFLKTLINRRTKDE